MIVWKPVLDYPDYEVSDTGIIRRTTATRSSKVGQVVKSHTCMGYNRITLVNGSIKKIHSVHRTVWQAFNGRIGPDITQEQINHIDGNKTNNHLSNLELVTAKQNMKHATVVLGHFSGPNPKKALKGTSNPKNILTEQDVMAIRSLENKATAAVVSDRYGVSKATVRDIWKKRTWKHLI